MTRYRHVLATALAVLLLCRAQCLAAPKQTYAYVSYIDGTIDQFRVQPNGKFIFLSKALDPSPGNGVVRVSRVAVDPLGRFAYAIVSDSVCQFKINENGTLTLLKTTLCRLPESHIPLDVVVDNTGRFVYVLMFAQEQSAVLQFSINKDGTLSPLNPASVLAGSCSQSIVAHPTKPFLYVANGKDGTISQFSIGADGVLVPLAEPNVKIGGDIRPIRLSSDGKYMYTVNEMFGDVMACAVSGNGSLKKRSSASYGTDRDSCCGGISLATSRTGTLYVGNGAGSAIYEFKMTPKAELVMVGDYKLTRDNSIKTREETIRGLQEKRAKDGKKKPAYDDMTGIDEEMFATIGHVYTVAFGPDDFLYVANSSGIARFRVEPPSPDTSSLPPTGRAVTKPTVLPDIIKTEEPSLVWPDQLAEIERKRLEDPYQHNVTRCPVSAGLVFFTR